MGHFAKVENGIVTQVVVVANAAMDNLEFPDSESLGQELLLSLGLGNNWKQTSYNNNFRGIYASPGYIYDEVLDEFIAPDTPE